MILFVILAIMIIAQIVTRIILNEKLKNLTSELNSELAKFENIDGYKSKNIIATVASLVISLIVGACTISWLMPCAKAFIASL